MMFQPASMLYTLFHSLKRGKTSVDHHKQPYGVFSHDVTAAMLVSQNKEMAAMLMSQTKPQGIELYFYANTFFCFSKPIWPVVT